MKETKINTGRTYSRPRRAMLLEFFKKVLRQHWQGIVSIWRRIYFQGTSWTSEFWMNIQIRE